MVEVSIMLRMTLGFLLVSDWGEYRGVPLYMFVLWSVFLMSAHFMFMWPTALQPQHKKGKEKAEVLTLTVNDKHNSANETAGTLHLYFYL